MLKTFTNEEIYNIGNQLSKAFGEEDNEHFFSAKVNFLIHKNKKVIVDAAVEIEKIRLNIVNKYAQLSEEGQFSVPQDKIEIVNKELLDLLQIEQELNIYMLDFEDLEDLQFTSAQMEALMFMIEEPEEEEADIL